MSATCHACGQRLPRPPKPEGPRVRPCLACGKPVESGRRGRPKLVHRGCRALLRKLKGVQS